MSDWHPSPPGQSPWAPLQSLMAGHRHPFYSHQGNGTSQHTVPGRGPRSIPFLPPPSHSTTPECSPNWKDREGASERGAGGARAQVGVSKLIWLGQCLSGSRAPAQETAQSQPSSDVLETRCRMTGWQRVMERGCNQIQ